MSEQIYNPDGLISLAAAIVRRAKRDARGKYGNYCDDYPPIGTFREAREWLQTTGQEWGELILRENRRHRGRVR